MSEKYQTSPAEIKKAEGMMTEKEKTLSAQREWQLEGENQQNLEWGTDFGSMSWNELHKKLLN